MDAKRFDDAVRHCEELYFEDSMPNNLYALIKVSTFMSDVIYVCVILFIMSQSVNMCSVLAFPVALLLSLTEAYYVYWEVTQLTSRYKAMLYLIAKDVISDDSEIESFFNKHQDNWFRKWVIRGDGAEYRRIMNILEKNSEAKYSDKIRIFWLLLYILFGIFAIVAFLIRNDSFVNALFSRYVTILLLRDITLSYFTAKIISWTIGNQLLKRCYNRNIYSKEQDIASKMHDIMSTYDTKGKAGFWAH